VHQSQTQQKQEVMRDPIVLFGTTTGNSWQFAEQLVREGQNKFDLTMRSQSLEDYDFESELAKESAVVIIVPTYEGGTPNATTKDFFNYLVDASEDFRVSKSLLDKVAFAVFGLGDTVYGDNFCLVGRKIDECMKKLGGNRMLSRGAGDAQYSGKQFSTFLERLWPSLLAALGAKDKLAKYRKAMKAKTKSFKVAEYVSDEDSDDKEPLADLEDLADGVQPEEEEDDDDSYEESEDDGTGELKTLLTPSLSNALSKQGYKLIGSHSGVKLCRWTKAMLRGRGGCYKHTFYNITSYQCMEMTPSLACANKCVCKDFFFFFDFIFLFFF
jgi:tRNA wybutosine-synthesizing protein 1